MSALEQAVKKLPEKKKESKSSLAQKLLQIQSELKAPKSQYNAFGKYNYRSCEDILNAVKPLLAEQELLLTVTDELMNIGDRYYIQATVKLYDLETDTGIEVLGYAREEETKKGMDGSQITGASSSYARKYALNGMFLIDDSKDSDATNEGAKAKSAAKTAPKPQAVADPDSIQAKLKVLILSQIPKGDLPEQRAQKAKAILKDISTFKGKDDKDISYTRDIKDMPDKWAATAYGTLKEWIEEQEKSQAKVEPEKMSKEEVESALSSDKEVDEALNDEPITVAKNPDADWEDEPENGDTVPF